MNQAAFIYKTKITDWSSIKDRLLPGSFGIYKSQGKVWREMVSIEDTGFIIHPVIMIIDGKRNIPFVMFQKPYEGKAVDSMMKYITGALWIDGSRVSLTSEDNIIRISNNKATWGTYGNGPNNTEKSQQLGRFPSNLIIHKGGSDDHEESMKQFPESGSPTGSQKKTTHNQGMFGTGTPGKIYTKEDGGNRSTSRYFLNYQTEDEIVDYLTKLLYVPDGKNILTDCQEVYKGWLNKNEVK